jgi:class 3 adenylate cyclase
VGGVRGAFTVDFSLDALADFLGGIHVSPRGRAFIATREGVLVVAPKKGGEAGRRVDAALAREMGRQLEIGHPPLYRVVVEGESYLGRAAPLAASALPWLVAVVVPERDYTASIDAQARRTILLALLALSAAVVGGVALARWIARPLRELMAQARRVRQGDLSVTFVSRSRDEIGSLARSMAEMVAGLRDRDFIRDTLGRYVSPELAAQCLRDRDALRLGGEARDVSLLMSDLRDFSELSQELGPEEMITLLNRYLAHMTRVILAHRGMINEFIGDAILVLFGAPFQQPDDAERVVRCAWAMQEAMRGFNDENRALGLPALMMGIGVHTGVVVAGNIGSPDRVKYGVVGPAVNLTARIQALTQGAQVLVSEATLRRTQHMVRVGPPRRVVVKGFAEPVTVYEVLEVTDGARMNPSQRQSRDAVADSSPPGR